MSELCGSMTPTGPCVLPAHSRGFHDAAPPTLRVPRNTDGHYQVSTTQLRRYGAVDLLGPDATETVRGCPRAYAVTYGSDPVPELPSPAAELGLLLHRALHWMHDHDCGPEDALGQVWAATLGFPDYQAALRILRGYLDRGGPMTRYATLLTELDYAAELFVDEEFGPVWFRGVVDNVSIDPTEPDIARVIDYKSAARPVAKDSLRGDVQLLGYVWLTRRWWRQQFGVVPDRVVAHLDLLRYSDLAIEYTATELEQWHEWACAMVRAMLRDTNPAPILNDGCTSCAVRWDCPAWLALPGEGQSMNARLAGLTPEAWATHFTRAERVKKLLGAQVDQIRDVLSAEALAVGVVQVGDQEWTATPATKNAVDVRRVAQLLLPDHPEVFEVAVTSSRAALERATDGLDPSLAARVLACVDTVADGMKVTRTKRTGTP